MKTKKGLYRRLLLTALFLAGLITAGCGDEGTTPAENGPYDATEPKYALANVEIAFDGGDVKILSGCLAGDFVFLFDVNDVGQNVEGYTIPASWTRGEFLAAAAHLFAGTYDTSLSNHWREVGTPSSGETSYQAAEVPLEIVVMLDANDGYAFDDGTCDYEFEKEASAKWFLTKWRDRSRECGCIGSVTFGRIMARYHP